MALVSDRLLSIMFYLLIAVITCAMAVQVSVPASFSFVNGQRTRKNLYNRLFLTGIFVILFMCSALRFDIGNDYRQYVQTAHEAYVGGYVVTEAGFNLFVRLVYGLAGSECYELIFAAFAFVTIYIFLKAFYRQSVSFEQSFFLFMTLGLYFQTYNTVRYYFALAIALYSMKYVLERDWIKFIFWIILASFFHKSVLLVIPVYWLASLEWKKIHIIAGVFLSALCYAGKGLVMKLALALYPSYQNTIYLDGGVSITSVIRTFAALALYCWLVVYSGRTLKEKDFYREIRFYGQLNLLALVACTFFSFLPVVTRIAYYFSASQLFMIPLIISAIEDETVKRRVKGIIAGLCAAYFIIFLFQAHHSGVKLLPYRSWLFTSERYIYK